MILSVNMTANSRMLIQDTFAFFLHDWMQLLVDALDRQKRCPTNILQYSLSAMLWPYKTKKSFWYFLTDFIKPDKTKLTFYLTDISRQFGQWIIFDWMNLLPDSLWLPLAAADFMNSHIKLYCISSNVKNRNANRKTPIWKNYKWQKEFSNYFDKILHEIQSLSKSKIIDLNFEFLNYWMFLQIFETNFEHCICVFSWGLPFGVSVLLRKLATSVCQLPN